MRIFVAALTLMLVVGCGEPQAQTGNAPTEKIIEKVVEKPPEKPAVVAPAVEAPRFTGELRALAEPNKYEIHLRIKGLSANPVIVQRYEGSIMSTIEIWDGNYVDSVKAGEIYHYFIKEPYTDLPLLKFSVPKDLEVSKKVELEGDYEFNRVFLRKDSEIVATGALKINATSLLSDDATINATYRYIVVPGDVGPAGNPITLKIGSASGRLLVKSNGADGIKGRDGHDGERGTDGAKGTPAELGTRIQGLVGQVFFCKTPPGNGGDGAGGANGENGEPGSDGGDSGPVFIEVRSESSLNVEVEARPGKGRAGGRGGRGGMGGEGGEPGATDPFNVCPKASAGARGDKGQDGSFGKDGVEGKQRPTCVKNGGKIRGECEAFADEKEKTS